MNTLVANIITALRAEGDPAHAAKAEHYNIHSAQILGVPTKVVRTLSRDYFRQLPDRSWVAVEPLCEVLLETGIYECRTVAFDWSFRCKRHFLPVHLEVFTDWLETHVEAWSDCDDLCTHTLGHLLWTYPALNTRLDAWTTHPNRWMRRGSAVALIYALRKGGPPQPAFHRADQLLHATDDLVQKGTGWLLKEVGQKHPDALFAYLEPRCNEMPRTMLRIAMEKLPPESRELLRARL